jgi:hypothetical protein
LVEQGNVVVSIEKTKTAELDDDDDASDGISCSTCNVKKRNGERQSDVVVLSKNVFIKSDLSLSSLFLIIASVTWPHPLYFLSLRP